MADDFDSCDPYEPTEADLNRVGLSKTPYAGKSAADYPYDPALKIEDMQDLDRLRCIADRELAQQMFNSFVKLSSWWGTGEAARYAERSQRRKENKETARLATIAQRAFKGDFGLSAKTLATRILFPGGYMPLRISELPALREFWQELQKLRRNE